MANFDKKSKGLTLLFGQNLRSTENGQFLQNIQAVNLTF